LLDKELSSIDDFFRAEEHKLCQEVDTLMNDIKTIEDSDWRAYEQEGEDSDGDSNDSGNEGGVSKVAKKVSTILLAGGKKTKRRSSKRRKQRTASSASGASVDERDLLKLGEPPEDAIAELDLEENAGSGVTEESERTSAQNQLQTRLSDSSQNKFRYNSYLGTSRGLANSVDVSSIWMSTSDWATDTKITFKLRMQSLFRELTQLLQFSTLNQTGFKKILKK